MTAESVNKGTRIPPVSDYGVIFNDTGSLGEINHLVGGDGTCWWMTLINGMHLPGAWNVVEYVIIPPGASCGEHQHTDTEEIYYILAGTAEMRIDGEASQVRAGDLITCPIGTTHGIANRGETEMRFFVVEVFPAAHATSPEIAHIPVHGQLRYATGYRGYDGDDLRVAQVNLTRYFTGPWWAFSEIEIPAGEAIGPYLLAPSTTEVLLVVEGEAQMIAGDQVRKGGPGLCMGTALGSAPVVRNDSDSRPLRLISTEVRATA